MQPEEKPTGISWPTQQPQNTNESNFGERAGGSNQYGKDIQGDYPLSRNGLQDQSTSKGISWLSKQDNNGTEDKEGASNPIPWLSNKTKNDERADLETLWPSK